MLPILFEPVVELVNKVVDRLVPDKEAAEKQKREMLSVLQTQEFQLVLEQIKVNAAEASSGSPYASGWRPTIGYICGFALLYSSIIEPLARFIATVVFHYTGEFPVIDTSITMQILIGMLGLGAMRSYDKTKGVAS